MSIRKALAISGLSVALLLGAGSASAQDDPDYTAFCTSLNEQGTALDAQVAQFDASIAASLAQVDALDAQLPAAYDAVLNSYRAYITTSSVSYHTQVAVAEAQIEAGLALYGC